MRANDAVRLRSGQMQLSHYLSMLQFIMTPQRGSSGSFLKMTRHLA
jgi:hypothetical protein